MEMKSFNIFVLLVLITCNKFHFECSKVIDKHVQNLRKEYRQFRGEEKIKLDESFFDIYNAVEDKIETFEKFYVKILKKWNKACMKFRANDEMTHKLKVVCENTASLLNSSANMRDAALGKLLSEKKLMKNSPPMSIFEDLCSEMETFMNKIWNVYSLNESCVRPQLKKIIPLFKPFVAEIFNLTKLTINRISSNYFDNCTKFHNNALAYVENFMESLHLCGSSKNIDKKCLNALVLKINIENKLLSHIKIFLFRFSKRSIVLTIVDVCIHQFEAESFQPLKLSKKYQLIIKKIFMILPMLKIFVSKKLINGLTTLKKFAHKLH